VTLRLPCFAALLFAAAALAVSCTTDNPAFCDSQDENSCGPGLECNLFMKECVLPEEVPAGCQDDSECTQASEPICDEVIEACRACAEGPEGDAECQFLDAGTDVCVAGECRECADANDCSAATPECSALGTCELCDAAAGGDDACELRDPEVPLCGSGGQCVQCRENADCQSTLCDAVAGTCIATDAVVFAAPGGTDADDCGAFGGTPCATLGGPNGALAKLDAEEDRVYVRLAEGAYDENVSLEGLTVIVLGDGADIRAAADAAPVLTIENSDVELRGVTIRNARDSSAAHGILCTGDAGQDLRLVGATISNNQGRGIEAAGCDVSVVDSVVSDNDEGGIRLTGRTLELVSSVVNGNRGGGLVARDSISVFIVNNFIFRNGEPFGEIGAASINTEDSQEPSVFDFNTIAENSSATLESGGAIVECRSDVLIPRHNIVYGNVQGPSTLGNCEFFFSNIEGGNLVNNNIDLPPTFVDASGGDYHLAPGSAGIDAGDESSAISVDIDGDVRPQGARLDMGADEFVPGALQSLPSR